MSGQTSSRGTVDEDGDYVIRPYEPSDAEGFLALSDLVWGDERSVEWLRHHYETNPYLDGPPMIVADAGGEVVGARPFVAVPMRAGGEDVTAIYLGNVMVHPEHRRQGLFTRMTELAVETFADRDARLFFNYANDKSAPGYRKLDFEAIGTGPEKQFRIQKPGAVLSDKLDLPAADHLGVVANEAMDNYLSLRQPSDASRGWTVERQSGIPAELLASLYDTPTPALHTRREEALYRWLSSDPYWEYETYVASRAGGPSAAVVVRHRPQQDDVWITDAVAPSTVDREAAFGALLDSVLTDHTDARVVSVTGPVIYERLFPEETLSEFGFLSSTQPGLSRFAGREDTVFVHSLGDDADGSLTVGGVDLKNPENWAVEVR